MTNITKPQYEELMEKLTDKTLSFGCMYQDEHDQKMGYKNVIWESGIDSTGEFIRTDKHADFYGGDEEFCRINKILGHPLLIGDVLEKMYDDNLLLGDNAKETLGDVLAFWTIAGGASKSIQTIVEESGWKDVPIDECWDDEGNRGVNCGTAIELKSGEANELLSFLYNLFIK